VLILSGSEDPTGVAAPALHARLPDSELVVLDGAGHACHVEQPWRFDAETLEFLRRRGVLAPN
jgi:pimeloyl-ACP methyl ester carboxylesterase